ncbi:LysR family transcriptional regulator [soil metagenome]
MAGYKDSNGSRIDLNAALVFVRVIQAGSFSRAAKQIEMPVSTVSAKVAALEKSLGVSLIQRTTRRLHLTESGEAYFKHAVRAVGELQLAQTMTQEARDGVRGKIKVTAPVEIGMSSLAVSVSSFLAKHHELQVELILTDRVVDLVGEGVDIAIRMGELKDSSLISKRIGLSGMHAFASPAYLKKNPAIKKPQDLENHACLIFSNVYDGYWTLERASEKAHPKSTLRVPIRGAFAANNLIAIHRLALDGRGVALLPSFLCRDDEEKKRLVPVLEGWGTKLHPVHLVYPQQSFLPKATRALIDHLAQTMQEVF